MFFNEYPQDKLTNIWNEFAKVKTSYSPIERWSEIVDSSYRNKDFLSLTLDDILYNYMKNNYSDNEEEKSEFFVIAMMIILAKKAIIDYNMEETILSDEFDTYIKTTRLNTLLDRTRDLSEFKEQYEKFEMKLKELFPDDEITLYKLFDNNECNENFDKICSDDEFGIQFIDAFSNMLAYDFVRNYFHLNNERNLNNIYNDTEEHCYFMDEDDCVDEPYNALDEC